MAILTPDKRYIVVRNRLWRAWNPRLTSAERDRHTRELMSARRAVRDALGAQDVKAERLARQRVNRAKVALGERGPVWWSDGAPDLNRHLIKNTEYSDFWNSITKIRAAITTLLEMRAVDATICPSEIARFVVPVGWRALMPRVRDVARELLRDGLVDVTQKGRALSAEEEWRGPIRIGRRRRR